MTIEVTDFSGTVNDGSFTQDLNVPILTLTIHINNWGFLYGGEKFRLFLLSSPSFCEEIFRCFVEYFLVSVTYKILCWGLFSGGRRPTRLPRHF